VLTHVRTNVGTYVGTQWCSERIYSERFRRLRTHMQDLSLGLRSGKGRPLCSVTFDAGPSSLVPFSLGKFRVSGRIYKGLCYMNL
jgi:hypothetical protein